MDFSSRSLPVRLAVLMTLALLPLGLIALWQTRQVVDNVSAVARAAVMAEAERAAEAERKILERVSGYAVGLGAGLGSDDIQPETCNTTFSEFVADQPSVDFAGFIDARGVMVCSSTGSVVDISDTAMFERARAQRGPVFDVSPAGVGQQDAAIVVNSPVFTGGALKGYVWISIQNELDRRPETASDVGVEYVVLTRDGTTLRGKDGVDTVPALLGQDGGTDEVFGRIGTIFQAPSRGGDIRLYAVSSLIPGHAVVVGSWPIDGKFASSGGANLALTLAFPVLMWIAGILVALFGLHRMVIRHVFDLRAAMRRFARGERQQLMVEMRDPPTEFGALQDSYNDLVQRLTRAEEKAEEDLHEKTVLLREVHHRVKNNLQLIASIMNMHGRMAQTPEARRLLGQLQRRVRGLATVHQTLDSTSRQVSIDSKTLIEQLARDLIPPIEKGGQSVDIKTEAESIGVGQDQAVALSMLVAEALTNAVKYVGVPNGRRPAIRVSFRRNDMNNLEFSVENTIGPDREADEAEIPSTGIGHRLIHAFVAQLDGKQTSERGGSHFRFVVSFPPAKFDPAPPADLPQTEPDEVAAQRAE